MAPRAAPHFALSTTRAQAILLFKFSQVGGAYTFSPASSIAISEALKLAIAAGLHARTGKPWAENVSAAIVRHYAGLSLLYTVNNYITFEVHTLADPGSYTLGKSATPYLVAALLRLTGERLHELQWVCTHASYGASTVWRTVPKAVPLQRAPWVATGCCTWLLRLCWSQVPPWSRVPRCCHCLCCRCASCCSAAAWWSRSTTRARACARNKGAQGAAAKPPRPPSLRPQSLEVQEVAPPECVSLGEPSPLRASPAQMQAGGRAARARVPAHRRVGVHYGDMRRVEPEGPQGLRRARQRAEYDHVRNTAPPLHPTLPRTAKRSAAHCRTRAVASASLLRSCVSTLALSGSHCITLSPSIPAP